MREPDSGPANSDIDVRAYAVIYGCNNKAGKAFSYFLMEKGFNLILIERDLESIQALEGQLRKLLPDSTSNIQKIVLNKFDQESINYAVGKYSTYHVKLFVNCKNSKR